MEENKIEMSKRDVIVCRGIWYVLTLLSIFGLSISLNLLWPSSRFLRDGAVSVTTFYAVTLIRYLFFTETLSTNWYKDFTTEREMIPQLVFALLATMTSLFWPSIYLHWVDKASFVLYMSLFTISLITGGIGLIQLSDKFRMEMKYAYFTLLCCWMCCVFGIFISLYLNKIVMECLLVVYLTVFFGYHYHYIGVEKKETLETTDQLGINL